ncbi:MarR family transcriptional regulator (plasmid) [Deinococcus sp. KNUC1210]|uniref:MarR family winged helix-turn-helix transcriptional regulator n=1 Tax=Deinococcus sp. KNUC1210 TaxID=2917691 RepID=UPI001EEF9174|nr:MarR family transcriptional regulator [Deinococcus sp. KNUC1210]ULH18154.1 MarR family transcriptional regulator [Deinococcus sp. KNUC1210]
MTSTPTLAEDLRVVIGTFVRRARRVDTIGATTAAVLGHLARQGEQSITDLALLEGVRHQSMARMVKHLDQLGLVRARPDPEDRRRLLILLTETGFQHLETERQRRSAWIAEALETRLTAEERTELRRLIGLLEKLSG